MIHLPQGNFFLSPLSPPPTRLDLPRPQARELENPTYLLQLLAEGVISIHQSGLTWGARLQQQSLRCVIWVPADSLNSGASKPWGAVFSITVQAKDQTSISITTVPPLEMENSDQ